MRSYCSIALWSIQSQVIHPDCSPASLETESRSKLREVVRERQTFAASALLCPVDDECCALLACRGAVSVDASHHPTLEGWRALMNNSQFVTCQSHSCSLSRLAHPRRVRLARLPVAGRHSVLFSSCPMVMSLLSLRGFLVAIHQASLLVISYCFSSAFPGRLECMPGIQASSLL